MEENGDGVKRGRPRYADRGEVVRHNGYTENQWAWLEREAKLKRMDVMTYIRQYPIQWWIDSVESARAGSIATTEDDKKFEKLISRKAKYSKSKSKKSNKE